MPIRAFGTFACKVSDYDALIEKVAGIKQQYSVEDVRERIIGMLDQLLMKWISKEGKDMFNLQANADAIGRGIREDLDMEMSKIGISIASFAISSFNYPEEVQKMAEKAAAQSMIGDVGRFQQVAMGEAMAKGQGGGTASDMAGMAMGMAMGQQMAVSDGTGHERRRADSRYGCRNRRARRRRSSSEFLQLRYEDESEQTSAPIADRSWYKREKGPNRY